MDPLQKYVAHLFSNYGDSPRIKDLKEEVLSNLRAKLEDLVAEGIDPDTALAEAKASITSVTDLVEDGIKVRIWPFRMVLTQTLLMYTLIAWIASIPLAVMRTGSFVGFVLICLSLVLTVLYFIFKNRNVSAYSSNTSTIQFKTVLQIQKWAWRIWGVFIAAVFLTVIATRFVSNLWFGYPIVIDGPYQAALLAADFILPCFTVIIPLGVRAAVRLLHRYEVSP